MHGQTAPCFRRQTVKHSHQEIKNAATRTLIRTAGKQSICICDSINEAVKSQKPPSPLRGEGRGEGD
jgi:hypothetical protein